MAAKNCDMDTFSKEVRCDLDRGEFNSSFLAYKIHTRLSLIPTYQREYPTDFVSRCDTCEDTNMANIAVSQEDRDIMEKVVESLESYRNRDDWVIVVGDAFVENSEGEIRFLPGRMERSDEKGARSQPWTLNEQIEYAQGSIVARKRAIAILEREKEIAKLECKASELGKFIEKVMGGHVAAGNFRADGMLVFEAPPKNEHRA